MNRILIPVAISILALIFLFSYQSGQSSDKVLAVVFCDVGQGDAIYIRTPGQVDILIDGLVGGFVSLEVGDLGQVAGAEI